MNYKKIKDLLKELNITTIAVTHDSYEAFYLADKCGIIIRSVLNNMIYHITFYHYPNSLMLLSF